jgi:hopanoid C-3 methylase
MKILFVRPASSPETIGLQHVMLVEPLELETMAALVGADDKPRIVDMILEKQPIGYFLLQERPGILCITGYITNIPEMKTYCRKAKQLMPGIVTIVGGVHCEVCPDDLNDPNVDYRVVRNATTVFPRLLEHIKGRVELPAGVLRYNALSAPDSLPAFDFSYPFPDRSLTARYREKYFYIFHDRVALIKTSFGCPYSCSFCFCRSITQDHYHERPLEDIIKELTTIREKDIYIVDDDFLSSRARVLYFIAANRSAGLDKHYLLYGRADFIAQNPDVMQEFAAIGLKTVIVGFESFSDKELSQYNKNIDADTNQKAMRVLNKYNIDCYATIIVSPDWAKEEFALCKRSLLKLGIHYVNLQPLTPLPGTELTVPDSDLIFARKDFHKWDLAHVSVRPRKMSVLAFYIQIMNVYQAVLFQPRFQWRYLKSYKPWMLWRMLKGVYMVYRQYIKKITESKTYA